MSSQRFSGDVLRRLAAFAARTDMRTLPAPIVEKAEACLLYAMSVGAAGLRAGQARQAVRAVSDAEGGGATRFLDDTPCNARAAAFANGTLFHVRVQDDAHPAGHVGVVVIPAALAVAEATAASGSALLAAIVSGYEVALRVGRDHAADSSARGFRTTPTYGVFGAAAAAGRVLGLDEAAMTHALALAANMASGLREFAECGSEDYAFQAGTAASNGILAARLAAAGATSGPSALDGNAGFFRAYGEGRDYASRVTDSLGEAFEFLAVTYKPYPICQFHRGVVRGCAALGADAGNELPASITVRMHPFEADFFGVRFAGPFATFPQAFMSAPFCAALAWARGGATLAGLTNYQDENVLAIIPRVTIVSDPGRARYAPRIDARLGEGSVRTWEEREAANAWLLTRETARAMASELAAEIGAAPQLAARLAGAVHDLRSAPTTVPLVDAMRALVQSVQPADSTVRSPHDGLSSRPA